MKKILVASTNKEVASTVQNATDKYSENFDAILDKNRD